MKPSFGQMKQEKVSLLLDVHICYISVSTMSWKANDWCSFKAESNFQSRLVTFDGNRRYLKLGKRRDLKRDKQTVRNRKQLRIPLSMVPLWAKESSNLSSCQQWPEHAGESVTPRNYIKHLLCSCVMIVFCGKMSLVNSKWINHVYVRRRTWAKQWDLFLHNSFD